MGFLIVWLAVVVSIGMLLVGWVLGPQAGVLKSIASPEAAGLFLVLALLFADAASFLRRRWRR